MNTRLPVETFELPVHEIRHGYRSAQYFNRTRRVMELEQPDRSVIMQVFQKKNAVLCGIDEAVAILRVGAGRWADIALADAAFLRYLELSRALRRSRDPIAFDDILEVEDQLERLWLPGFDELTVEALHEGDDIEAWEPVLRITGPYHLFAHLESVYLGVLARATLVATNTRSVVEAAGGIDGDKPVLFFADRFDRYSTQGSDGYAAKVGGASGFASDAMGAWWDHGGMGTMPHALIAAYGGDVVAACRAFRKYYRNVPLIPLVDFNNDCVGDALKCAHYFKDDLWGVRLDTSENMVDASILRHPEVLGDFKPTGVNPILVKHVRDALDAEGFHHVKIVVSGGFTAQKIREFELAGVPVDSYAVGSSLLQGSNDFTADVVMPVSKAGRQLRPSTRLELVS